MWKDLYLLCAVIVLLALLIASKVMAAELLWEMPVAGPVIVEVGPAPTGPFVTVATVPEGVTRFLLTPGQWGHYRVRNSAGPSNTAQYALDVYSDTVTERLSIVEGQVTETVRWIETIDARLLAVPAPTPEPVGNITVRLLDADRAEITGLNCASLRTTGSGLRRVVECVH
jgi:hypothetical protein